MVMLHQDKQSNPLIGRKMSLEEDMRRLESSLTKKARLEMKTEIRILNEEIRKIRKARLPKPLDEILVDLKQEIGEWKE